MRRPGLRLPIRLAQAALLLSLAACTSPRPPPSDALFHDDSAVLVSTNLLATRPFTVVQRVRGKQGTADVAFECVVQLSQHKLTVTGMTPYSTRAFVVEQDGVAVQSRGFTLRDVPFEPVQVLYDIHRVFFRGLSAPQTDGTHELLDHGEVVRELWQDGHVVQRSFHALDTFSRLLMLEFEGAPAPVIAPRVRLTNLHYGYSLEIENVEQQRLDQGYTLDVAKKLAP
jgi:hypothetical protein